MIREHVGPLINVAGRARLGLVTDTGELFRNWCKNMLLNDSACIFAKLLSGQLDGKQYKIGGMYMTYENNGGAAVSVPTVARADGIDYYNSLSGHATRDYLRVPLIAAVTSNSDSDTYSTDNTVTYYAQSTGTTGVHGKPFNDTVDSRIFEVALVAFPVFADATQDLVLARLTFPSAEQIVKILNSQISCAWEQIYG